MRKKSHVIWYILSYLLNNGGQDEARKDIKQHAGHEWHRALNSVQKKGLFKGRVI